MYESFVRFVRKMYRTDEFIPLHEPRFIGNEKSYLIDTIDSTYVSSVGSYVEMFENMVADYVGSKYAIATINGTSALHISLLLTGVKKGEEVVTQSLSFVATCNAISYCGATPVFVDVDKKTLGMCPLSFEKFVAENSFMNAENECINKNTGKVIRACLPMHTFGHSVLIDDIKKVCDKYNICLVEDAAESLGSFKNSIHTGRTGKVSAISFNGNKIITSGSGGMIITDDEKISIEAKHLTTTAKKNHKWKYEHDRVGYNYRLPNLNAALGCAQMESLHKFVIAKRYLANEYESWAISQDVGFVKEPSTSFSNYWLNALVLDDKQQLEKFLEFTNSSGVMTRPIWEPMHQSSMYKNAQKIDLSNTEWLMERIVNIPSSILK